jgi:Ca2+/Na+ antiporter
VTSESENRRTEKEQQATSSLTLNEILLRLIGKLKEELFILAAVFCLLVVITLIFSGEFPLWAAITFITIYVIATTCYMYPKTTKAKKEIEAETSKVLSTKWEVFAPKAFQDPFQITLEKPSLRIVHFDLVFKVKNLSNVSYLLKVYVNSTTQAVVFPLDSPKKVWKRAYGVMPYREEVKISLDNVIELPIARNGEAEYVFHGWYRPLLAHDDFLTRRNILILYRALGVSEDEKWTVVFHERRMEIPFKKRARANIPSTKVKRFIVIPEERQKACMQRMMDVNVKGMLICSQVASRHMLKRKSGNIINIVADFAGGGLSYMLTKPAGIPLTKGLARTLAPHVRVNAIKPGSIDTGWVSALPDKDKKKLTESIPLKRWGQPEDVAKVAVFLASDESAYITACMHGVI